MSLPNSLDRRSFGINTIDYCIWKPNPVGFYSRSNVDGCYRPRSKPMNETSCNKVLRSEVRKFCWPACFDATLLWRIYAARMLLNKIKGCF